MTDSFSPAQARRIALAAQGFSRARPARASGAHMQRAMVRMGVLQIDSVNVFARSHLLPLFSRLGAYPAQAFERLLFSPGGAYVEYLPHEAGFIPRTDWSLWRFRMEAFARRWSEDAGSWAKNNSHTIAWVRDELAARGPLRPAELRDDEPREAGGWWNWDGVKMALEVLWRTGEVAISGRRGFERRYALAEHVLSAETLNLEIPAPDAIRELVRRAARSCGIATAADLADYYRLKDRPALRRALSELQESGEIRAVQVRGPRRADASQPAFLHHEAALPRRIDAAAVLSPFDPVVWFRPRALRMFDLDYRIEIYVPAAQRRYGYYSLPVLVGDRIVMRVDLKANRANDTLLVQSAWWEPQSQPDDALAVAEELLRAAAWQGLSSISVSSWGDAAHPLAEALHAAGEKPLRHEHPVTAPGARS